MTLLLLLILTAPPSHNYPCGPGMPGPIRFLIPQGVAGADFRPACRTHDRRYKVHNDSRRSCDRQFLRDMDAACKHSRRPRLCRLTAKGMYLVTRVCGSVPFQIAHDIRNQVIK